MPVIGFLSGRSLASDSHLVASFRKGLSETGYVEGQNVAIEYRWAERKPAARRVEPRKLSRRPPKFVFEKRRAGKAGAC
jgi:hypothetical protein